MVRDPNRLYKSLGGTVCKGLLDDVVVVVFVVFVVAVGVVVVVFVVADDHGQGEPRLDDNAQRGQRFALQAVMASSTRARRVSLRECHDPAVGYEPTAWLPRQSRQSQLWCLKEHQAHVRQQGRKAICICARVFGLPSTFASLANDPDFLKLMEHYDGGDGREISLRPQRRKA